MLLDDFIPQPGPGQLMYPFNRMSGDKGVVNDSLIEWGGGLITNTISQGNSWGGLWKSLNHPIGEALPIDFSAILPPQILPAY